MSELGLSFTVTPIYLGLIMLLTLPLVYRVVKIRQQGDALDPDELNHRMRVHANLIEYAPLVLLMLASLELMGLEDLYLHILGALFVAARVGHAIGYGSTTGFSYGRFVGTLVTWIIMAVGGVLLIVMAVA